MDFLGLCVCVCVGRVSCGLSGVSGYLIWFNKFCIGLILLCICVGIDGDMVVGEIGDGVSKGGWEFRIVGDSIGGGVREGDGGCVGEVWDLSFGGVAGDFKRGG